MSTNMSQDPEKNIEALGRGEAPVLEQLAQMTIDTRARSGLDDETFTLVRIAALVASSVKGLLLLIIRTSTFLSTSARPSVISV